MTKEKHQRETPVHIDLEPIRAAAFQSFDKESKKRLSDPDVVKNLRTELQKNLTDAHQIYLAYNIDSAGRAIDNLERDLVLKTKLKALAASKDRKFAFAERKENRVMLGAYTAALDNCKEQIESLEKDAFKRREKLVQARNKESSPTEDEETSILKATEERKNKRALIAIKKAGGIATIRQRIGFPDGTPETAALEEAYIQALIDVRIGSKKQEEVAPVREQLSRYYTKEDINADLNELTLETNAHLDTFFVKYLSR